MLKLLLLPLLLLFTLNASDKVEIYASKMDSKDNIVRASGGVTLIYKDYFLTADSATYDRESGDLELYDNIRVNQNSKYKILGNYAKLNIAKKERMFRPFFMSDKQTQLWLSAKEGEIKDKSFDISEGVLSGCDPVDPLWKIEFSSSDYDANDKWINIYQARLYIEDIPVFYTPYFGYSLDTTRRTGLLTPSFGYSNDEGLYYEQPFYIAEQNWWDLELKPQVRTSRGSGIYEEFRFVDSKTSSGSFKAGYFKEKEEYFTERNLENRSHYGFNFKYDNSDFINQWFDTDFRGQSGIYADINSMNDVDYINLSSNDIQNTSTATQVLSRVNLFYNTDQHYFGAYVKYYEDLTLASNEETLQKMPTLQYHNYLDTFLEDHLLYNLDAKVNNITRVVGKRVTQTNINLPITLQTSLFDEYLNVSYSANVFMQHSLFSGEEKIVSTTQYEDGYLLRNSHTLALTSQLTRAYEDFSHVVGFGVSYNADGAETSTGYYENQKDFCSAPENKNAPQCDFYNISSIQEEAALDFVQYVYGKNAKQILYHRLSQRIANSESDDRYGELENELDYAITDYFNIYNNMYYNYKEQKFSKVFNSVTLKGFGVNCTLSHLYRDTFIPKTVDTPQYTSYLTSTLSYTYNTHYSFNALYNYDLETDEEKSMEVGFLYTKRCWDFGIRYSENRRPVLTTTTESFEKDKYIYLTVVLKPIMRPGDTLFNYKLPNSK